MALHPRARRSRSANAPCGSRGTKRLKKRKMTGMQSPWREGRDSGPGETGARAPRELQTTALGRCGRPLERIISGGQTGVDRAALDVALRLGIPHGGWCPRGRWAEDGRIPDVYQLRETPSDACEQRTEWNVRDADATVIFSISSELTGGSAYTREAAERMGKPWLHLARATCPEQEAARLLRDFLHTLRVRVLNVAGPRASTEPEAALYAARVLEWALGDLPSETNGGWPADAPGRPLSGP